MADSRVRGVVRVYRMAADIMECGMKESMIDRVARAMDARDTPGAAIQDIARAAGAA